MATTMEKLNQAKVARPIPVATDPRRLGWSKDRCLIEDRRAKEIAAKLEAEKARLEELANQEQENLEKLGAQDNSDSSDIKDSDEEITKLKAELEELKKKQESQDSEE